MKYGAVRGDIFASGRYDRAGENWLFSLSGRMHMKAINDASSLLKNTAVIERKVNRLCAYLPWHARISEWHASIWASLQESLVGRNIHAIPRHKPVFISSLFGVSLLIWPRFRRQPHACSWHLRALVFSDVNRVAITSWRWDIFITSFGFVNLRKCSPQRSGEF